MATYSLRLWFQGGPIGTIAQVALQTWTTGIEDDLFISPQCVSFEELDEQITRLKRELDEIRESGRRRFAAQERAWRAAAEQRSLEEHRPQSD